MTIVIDQLDAWRALRATFDPTLKIGFVGTMGNLHQGHLSLCQRSQAENDLTIVSLFVNPTQFNEESDYLHYPRTVEADLNLLKAIKVDYCLLPSADQLYHDGYQFRVDHQGSQALEGQFRPGHFCGVLTVVMKLFNLIKPHHAYFGEKDFEQFQLIKDMAKALFLDVQVHACPTVRERSSLAMSSRNNRLSPAQKKQADLFAKIFHQPHKSLEEIQKELENAEIKIEYLRAEQQRRFAAAYIGEIRLIDNYACET